MSAISRWFRSMASWPIWRGLRLRLVLLVLLALLPSLILLYLTARQERIDALEYGRDEVTRIARLVAADQQAVTSQIGSVLGALVLNPDLQGDVTGACNSLLGGILDGGSGLAEDGVTIANDVRVDGATIQQLAVVDANGDVLCSGTRGSATFVEPSLETAAASLRLDRFVSGDQRQDEGGTVLADFAVPIPVEPGATGRSLVALVEISTLDQFVAAAPIPDGAFISVVDRKGETLQHYPNDSAAMTELAVMGTPVAGDISLLQEETNGPAELVDALGAKYVYAVDSAWSPGIDGTTRVNYVVVGIPEATVVRDADAKFDENLGRLGIAGVVGLVAAWVGSDLIGGRDAGTRMGLVRDYYHLFESGRVDQLDLIIAPDFVDNSAPLDAPGGIEGLRQNIAAFRSAFPDGKVSVRDIMADHDSVMARVTLEGTQVAPYAGIPPANEPVIADGVETFRFAHGMVVESWSLFGALRERAPVTPPDDDEPPAKAGLLRRMWRRRPWGGAA